MLDNINGRDVQRKNVVSNVDESSLRAPWQDGLYKNTKNITKHEVYKDIHVLAFTKHKFASPLGFSSFKAKSVLWCQVFPYMYVLLNERKLHLL